MQSVTILFASGEQEAPWFYPKVHNIVKAQQ
jgi:hypothetical protein